MAKSAIHKLSTEILHSIENLIYIRLIDKHQINNILLKSFSSAMHSMPNFAVLGGESRHEVERQITNSSHIRVRHPWETCSFNSFSASVSTLNHLIFTYFVFAKFLLPFESQASFQSEEFGPYDYAPQPLSLVACSLSGLNAHAHAKKTLVSNCNTEILKEQDWLFPSAPIFAWLSKISNLRLSRL